MNEMKGVLLLLITILVLIIPNVHARECTPEVRGVQCGSDLRTVEISKTNSLCQAEYESIGCEVNEVCSSETMTCIPEKESTRCPGGEEKCSDNTCMKIGTCPTDITCKNDDNTCPAGCTTANDNDCKEGNPIFKFKPSVWMYLAMFILVIALLGIIKNKVVRYKEDKERILSKCPKCNSLISKKDIFCEECGKRLR